MHHNRVRKVDARTRIITTVAGSGALGPRRRRRAGDRGAHSPARPGIAVVPRAGRQRDDLHRRLLQRQRPRRRSRRHHPRRDRRRARGVRRADARRLRAGPKRGWLYVADSSNDKIVAADHPADRAEPRAAAAGDAAAEGRRMTEPVTSAGAARPTALLRWTLSFMRPYRGRVALLVGPAACRKSCSAPCSRGRWRSSSTTCSTPAAAGGKPLSGVDCSRWIASLTAQQPLRAAGRRRRRRRRAAGASTSSCRPTARRCRSTPASGWSTTCAARLFEHLTGARPPPSHHHQHRRRGLPRRRRRLRDREPGDERHVSARDVDHRAGGDVRRAALA